MSPELLIAKRTLWWMVGLGVPTLIFAAIAAIPAIYSVLQWRRARLTSEELSVLKVMDAHAGIIFQKLREQGEEGAKVYVDTRGDLYQLGLVLENLVEKNMVSFGGTKTISIIETVGGKSFSLPTFVDLYRLTAAGRMAAVNFPVDKANEYIMAQKMPTQP